MEASGLATAATDLADPLQGLRAVAALRRLLETLELRQVEQALGRGWSWADIGAELGVSRQAVHKKYAKRLRHATAPL